MSSDLDKFLQEFEDRNSVWVNKADLIYLVKSLEELQNIKKTAFNATIESGCFGTFQLDRMKEDLQIRESIFNKYKNLVKQPEEEIERGELT